MGNDFTKEEQDILDRLKKPKHSFSHVQEKVDEICRNHGFKDHEDFLIKTGWLKAICSHDFKNTREQKIKGYDPVTFDLREIDE